MEDKNIRKYAKLMQELELTGLEVTEDGATLRLERTAAAVQTVQAVQTAAPAAAPAAQAAPADGTVAVPSPMVGVFYGAPTETAAPFVRVGDKVHKGDVLCIIEAMKLMNEITAEQDGVVAEVCCKDGQVVDYGRELFRMRRV